MFNRLKNLYRVVSNAQPTDDGRVLLVGQRTAYLPVYLATAEKQRLRLPLPSLLPPPPIPPLPMRCAAAMQPPVLSRANLTANFMGQAACVCDTCGGSVCVAITTPISAPELLLQAGARLKS